MAVRLSAPRAGRPLPPRKIPSTLICWRLSRLQGHSAGGRIRSIEKSNDFIGIRTRDLPACSIVPQPTTLPCSKRENDKLVRIWKEMVVASSRYAGIFLKWLRKAMRQDNRCPDRDSNREPLAYESRALPLRQPARLNFIIMTFGAVGWERQDKECHTPAIL
jgi:hypothetical protein